ncbi:MAG TPA: lytic transglycosylase domain-containing protein [Pyrinomonadaceae bacterium]|nr:lytic transglycosylase domain-containing protein [Pyrinomonadaceae bacterium]
MKFPRKFPRRVSYLHSAKFAPFAIISLFFVFNFTGIFFSPVMAPVVDAATQVETIPDDIPLSGDCDLDWIIFRAGEKAGVDPRFIHAVIKQESKYDPKAVSPVGAQGLMQMMPGTAKRFGLKDPFDATANVEAGTKYLKWLLKRFDGDVSLALAGYNAGEGSVDKYKGVPPYSETQNYVKKIVATYGKTYHPVLTADDAKLAFHLTANAETSIGL